MEHGEDRELRELLREWRVSDAPPLLDRRVLGGYHASREAWWWFLLTESIRIPVPVGLALAVLLVLLGGLMRRRPAPASAPSTVSLVDFRPVSDLNVRVIRQHESN